MAELSQIKLPSNASYDLKDATARTELIPIPNSDIDALFDNYDLNLGNAEGESF